ncbi:putative hsp70 protein [Metarhizium acridum CQMa 102]|uniref:Putative hsp70 protein n=1 Tax=Metarhizium acridum (strain CQMa 102) TaxID=655827 RepID=E9DX16_METAQ|nr:putative hsp70 protein [Metarhizium acridum CQMa 102]EFY91879.1 putative hsp70 protein [Metarhizium acridum CQMa 102]
MDRSSGVNDASEVKEKPMKFLIELDFGTTFSSVASTLVNAGEPQKESLFTEWGEGLSGDKVPRILRYENGDTISSCYWGFEAEKMSYPEEKIHECFKLGLCPEIEPSPALGSEKVPRNCSSDILGVKSAIDRLYSEWERSMCLENRLSLPAMWSYGARETTRECAVEPFPGDPSKKDELSTIAKPEGAELFALSNMLGIGFEAGDTFVICDASGGYL